MEVIEPKRRGGFAAQAKRSPERRTEIARMGAAARWRKTHEKRYEFVATKAQDEDEALGPDTVPLEEWKAQAESMRIKPRQDESLSWFDYVIFAVIVMAVLGAVYGLVFL